MTEITQTLLNPSVSCHHSKEGSQGKPPLPQEWGKIFDFGVENDLTCYVLETSSHSIEKWCGNLDKKVPVYCKICGMWRYVPIRCKKRTCPECQFRRNKQLQFGYIDIIKAMHAPKLMTLTSVWVRDLRTGISEMRAAFSKMMRKAPYRKSVLGYFSGFHYVPKPGGWWYVHMHVIVDSIYIPQKKLSQDWKKATGSGYIVDIRKVWSPAGGLKYILGYITATGHLQGHESEVNYSLKGSRLVSTGGSCYNLPRNAPRLICPRCHGSTWGRAEDAFYEPQQLEYAYFQAMQRCLDDFT